LEGLVEWTISVVETLGYAGVAALVALENLFPPIPSEVVLPLAGFVAAGGGATVWGMVAAATLGSMIGAYALYGISAAIGPVRLRQFVVRYGRWFGLSEEDLDRSEGWFDDHARLAVFVCRCIPLMRSLISIPAGFRRMPLGTFTLFTLAGSLIWNIGLVGAGYLLGEEWERVERPLDFVQKIVLGIVGLAIAWLVWRGFVKPRIQDRGQ
jgi:membrane protein DedA with SNARE-associated domain